MLCVHCGTNLDTTDSIDRVVTSLAPEEAEPFLQERFVCPKCGFQSTFEEPIDLDLEMDVYERLFG